ncbi:hypothetical protein [Ammoniphilus sp. CFH 90114]|uniref:hypothetical protein n=1 Tax=Ammoniphilus sp. CFH 90114 TaxID=2493665 RepID=UPI0013E9967C|nr:hypothetical protein [Ammoniphilus sp. CFH 90114]
MSHNKPSEPHRPDTSKNGLMKKYPLSPDPKERTDRTRKILTRFKSLDIESNSKSE